MKSVGGDMPYAYSICGSEVYICSNSDATSSYILWLYFSIVSNKKILKMEVTYMSFFNQVPKHES